MKNFIVIAAVVLFAGKISAQSGISIIANGYASPIILENVDKISDPAKTKDTTLPAPAFTYTLQQKRYLTTVHTDTIRAAKMGNEPLQKLYRTYARMGVGNYSSFLAEFDVNSLRSKTSAWGVHLKHFNAGSGPKDVQGKFSGFSQQDVNLYGKYFLKHHVLGGGIDYDRNVVYNYGSVDSAALITKDYSRQEYNYTSLYASLLSHLPDSTSINHKIDLRYYHLNDLFRMREDNFTLAATAGRYIRSEMLNVDFGVDYNKNTTDNASVNDLILKLRPVFKAHNDKFDAWVATAIYHDASDKSLTYFCPQAGFSYNIINHIIVPYITLDGYLERNSFRSLTLSNPFMLSSEALVMQNTQHKYELSGGLRGSITDHLYYDVRATRVDLANQPFFINTTFSADPLRNKFLVVYDDVNVVQLHGQIGWQKYEKARVMLTGDWFKYTMTNEAEPWHTPWLKIGLLGEYNLQNKIIAKMDVYYNGSSYAKLQDASTFTTVTLKGYVDANIGLEYRYTKFLSIFINFNNVAAQRYYRWYAYPSQKFNLLGGLTYTF